MIFPDIVRGMKKRSGISLKDSRIAAKAFLAEVAAALSRGEDVRIHGFGRFAIEDRPGRVYRNFSQREIVRSPAKRKVRFTPFAATTKAAAKAKKRR